MPTTKRELAMRGTLSDDSGAKKSPFRLLLETAAALGIKRIHFEVDLEDYTEDERLRWYAQQDGSILVYPGTNGQHALTELIAERRLQLKEEETK